MSSGGDRDTINTLYFGGPNDWSRGGTLPDNKADERSFGKSVHEQEHNLFGGEPAMIHDAASKTNYVITV